MVHDLIDHIFESMFIEIVNKTERNFIVGVIYRSNTESHPDIEIFSSNLEDIMDIVQQENKSSMIMGDANVDLLKFQTHVKNNNYIDSIFSHGFLPNYFETHKGNNFICYSITCTLILSHHPIILASL